MGCVLRLFVSQTAPPAPADRLALIVEGLCQAVARNGGVRGLAGPFIILVWSRLRRTAVRFAHAAMLPSGTRIDPDRPVSATPSDARGKQSRGRPAKERLTRERPQSTPPLLPRHKAWLLRLVPETASGASQLRHFLADPEVATLLTNAPHLGRILRPLCFALGIRPAQALPPLPLLAPGAAPSAPPMPSHAPPEPAEPPPAAPPPAAPQAAAAAAPPVAVLPLAMPPRPPGAPALA
jgi:hypothetical protein